MSKETEEKGIDHWECPGCHHRMEDSAIKMIRQNFMCGGCVEYRLSDYIPILREPPPEEEPKIEWAHERQSDGSWDWKVWCVFYDRPGHSYYGNEPSRKTASDAIQYHIELIEKREEQKEKDI